MRAGIRGLWNGEYSLFGAIDNFNSVIRLHLRQAWNEGAAEGGIQPDELTPNEIMARDEIVNGEMLYVPDLARDIMANDRQSGGKLAPLLRRADNYASRWERVKMRARMMAQADQKFRWDFGDTVHCVDCETMNGRVYRGSIWTKYGIEPRSPQLNCFGIHCECKLTLTNERATPGRPPALVGPGVKLRRIIHKMKHLLNVV